MRPALVARTRDGARVALVLPVALVALVAVVAAEAARPAFDLRERIVVYLEERAPQPPRAVEVPPLGDFALPGIDPERVQVDLSSHPRAPRVGRVPVTVTLSVDGRVVRRGVVNAQVRVDVPVVVALVPVRRGDTIHAEQLSIEQRDVSELPEGWVGDPSLLVGRQARRSLKPGTLWRSEYAEIPPSVVRGELVSLLLEHGPLVIQGKGIARKDARAGEWVRVVNADSKRELLGRVDPEGIVHVEF